MVLKITNVKTVLLTGPCTNDKFLLEARQRRSAAFIEILTSDSRLIGLGETYAGYFCPELVPTIVEFFKPILVGQDIDESDDPTDWIRELTRRMFVCESFWCRVGVGAIVITGIEAALWDISGKLRKKPVFELLGGSPHQKLPGYATGGPSNYPKDRLAAKADYYQSLGFSAFKIGAGKIHMGKAEGRAKLDGSIAAFEADKLEFLRGHVGPEVKIMLDAHMGNSTSEAPWDVKTAIEVARVLEPFDLFFLEEALPYIDAEGYAQLASQTKLSIAGGECLSTMPEWWEYIRRGSFDIAQPDASFVGGLLEFKRIAAEFDKRGKNIATHAWGAGGSLMQNIHCGFACKNTVILEIPPDFAALHGEVVGDSFRFENGYVLPPQTPGLGIELADDLKNRFPFVPGSGEFISVPGKKMVG
jgi:L-alanine-DL-glutamate epimerase-like enolase superfamily enzyme